MNSAYSGVTPNNSLKLTRYGRQLGTNVTRQKTMDQTLTIFNQAVSDISGVASTVGLPEGNALDSSAVLVWPWRLEEQMVPRGRPDAASAGPLSAELRIHCVVLAQDPGVLFKIKTGLYRQPPLEKDGVFVMVHYENLPVADILALFSAARLVPRLCLPYVVQQVAG
jgi:hypothetical protein